MRKFFGILLCATFFLLTTGTNLRAQFREEAFSQQYNDDADTLGRDSTDVMFSFKDYFGGLRHKKEAKIGTMFAGSATAAGSVTLISLLQPASLLALGLAILFAGGLRERLYRRRGSRRPGIPSRPRCAPCWCASPASAGRR